MGGQTAFAFIETPAVVPQITAGNLRPLAVTMKARSPMLPDVPTLAEAGVPDVLAGSWFGLLAPAGTPTPIVKKLESEVRRIVATDDFKARMTALSSSTIGSTSEEFAARMESEVKMWTAVAKLVNIKFEQ
jgi:tripartite-type tricarboxylate transporter receptor subunit TctC